MSPEKIGVYELYIAYGLLLTTYFLAASLGLLSSSLTEGRHQASAGSSGALLGIFIFLGIQGIFACSDGPWVVDRLGAERTANSKLTRKMKYKYEIIIYWSEDDQSLISEVPELAGCKSDGGTYQEAIANVEVIIDEWIETAKR